MEKIKTDQETARERTNPIEDQESPGLEVTASLRDQQLEDLASKLEDMEMGEKVADLWHRANADRAEWLERQEKFLVEYDEFLKPIYNQPLDWSSNLHLPTILTVCKTYHSRMYSALMDIDPPFSVKARQAANVERAALVSDLIRYTLKDWANDYQGVEETVDRWLWDWITRGVGILKGRWDKKFTRFKDVEITEVQDVVMETDPLTGQQVPRPIIREVEREIDRTEKVCDGPVLERVPVEDVVIVGGEGDPQNADSVHQQIWYTANELWSLADQKRFRKDPVKRAIEAGRDSRTGTDGTGLVKQAQIEQSGMADVEKTYTTDRYHVVESYMKVDLDGSGITTDVIVWVHLNTKEILRATYLRRVSPTGIVPFFKADFHKRHGTEYGAGLVELLYSLGKELDAMHNITIDVGIVSSMPFGFYRPTASSLKDEGFPLEPGTLIPVDNPQTDIYFPNLGVRTSFGMQEQAALQNQIDRLTSISDLNLGLMSSQGAARTATGVRGLLGESSNNLSIYIRRMNRPWARALKHLFSQLQVRLPKGFQFRVLGDDGNAYWSQVKTREDIAGMYDFELEPNSSNSNKMILVEQANMIYQATQNPIDLQLGLVTPAERYEAIANQLKVNGIKDVSKYVRKPEAISIRLSPIEVLNRIAAGIDAKMDPAQDLQGFADLIEHFMSDDMLWGQFNEAQAAAIIAKLKEVMALQAAIQQAQAQAAATEQQMMNSSNTMQPQNVQPMAVQQPAPQGEGG